MDKLFQNCLTIFCCLYSFTITMNEFIRNKSRRSKIKGANLFAFGIGIMISLFIFAYAKAQQPIIEIPTGNTFPIGTDWTIEKWEIEIRNEKRVIRKPVIVNKPRIENEITSDWGSEKTSSWWIQSILVKWFPEWSIANDIATYAYKISWGDMDFLMTMKAENWGFDMFKQSNVPDKNWPNGREDSRGLCQLHRNRHKNIVDTKEFRESREYQVEVCRQKYKWWTKFYWYNVRMKFKNDFTFIK